MNTDTADAVANLEKTRNEISRLMTALDNTLRDVHKLVDDTAENLVAYAVAAGATRPQANAHADYLHRHTTETINNVDNAAEALAAARDRLKTIIANTTA